MAQSTTDMSIDEQEKSERVCTYLTPTKKSAIETASGDQSVASWIRGAINQRLKQDQQNEILDGTNAEQRLEAIAAEAADDLEKQTEEAGKQIARATRQYHHLLAVNAVYSIASFRLLGDYGGFSDIQRKTAILDGQARLHDDDEPTLGWDDLGDPTDPPTDDARASESRAQKQEQQPKPPESWDVGDDPNRSNDLDDILGDENG